MTWTRLQDTAIWDAARAAQAPTETRVYHDWSHVLALYEHAEHTLGYVYDPALDFAILCHDVVHDAAPAPERRSIQWMMSRVPGVDRDVVKRARDLIVTTIDHRLDPDPRLVLLDLANFADPDARLEDTAQLAAEAAGRGLGREDFAAGSARYLAGLHERLYAPTARPLSLREAALLDGIRTGIEDSVAEMRGPVGVTP